MFGFFKKKKTVALVEQPAPQVAEAMQPSADSLAKLAEWESKLTGIKEGFYAAIEAAKVASESLIASGGCDLNALDFAWAGVEKRLEKDQKALYRAWSSTDTILSRDEMEFTEQRALAETEYHEENNELEIAHVGAYREAKARAAQAKLELAGDPNTRIQVAHCIGEWQAFEHWREMKRAEMRIGRHRKTQDVPMDLLHALNLAAKQYWETALGTEAELVPHLRAHLPKTIDARMKGTRRILRDHWQWRAYEDSLQEN